jgi:nitroreductase / dihydropteridine reductase
MSRFTDNLTWRHATKAFDPKKKVSPQDLQKILDATRLAPTSFGLQPFHVILVNDPLIREKIFQAGWKQPQYTTAAELMVFCSRSDISDRISEYLDLSSGGDASMRERLKGYEGMMRGALGKMSPAEVHVWAARQAYIALGFAMAACAELNIDSCPMEGFSPPDIDKALELPSHMKTTVILTIGYRSEGTQVRPKVRFPESDFFSKK